eukprot:359441-Chlamydomonas_euryale.AAC.8
MRLPQPQARRVSWWCSALHTCLQVHMILVADERLRKVPRETGWRVVRQPWGLVGFGWWQPPACSPFFNVLPFGFIFDW